MAVIGPAIVITVSPVQWNQSPDSSRGAKRADDRGVTSHLGGVTPTGTLEERGSVGGGVVSNSQSDMLIYQVGNSAQRLIRPLFIV